MAELVLLTLVRLLLPFTLIFATLARPVGISLVYLSMFMVSPWLLQAKVKSHRALLNICLLISLILGGLFSVGHLALNFTNLIYDYLTMHAVVATTLRQIGFVRFTRLRAIAILHWILPDMMVAIVAVVVLIFMKISDKFKTSHTAKTRSTENLQHSEVNRLLIIEYIRSVLKTSPIFALVALFFAATIRPSLPGILYFMIFIVTGTYWALNRHYSGGLQFPLMIVGTVLSLHIICYCFYQLPIIHRFLDEESFWARAMAFEIPLKMYYRNKNGDILKFSDELKFDSYISPVAVMCAYFLVILKILQHRQYHTVFSQLKMKITHPSESTQNSENGRNEPSTLEQFFYMISDGTSFIYKNSYILLNVIMMIWSIIYHSWLTFVLLIWANVLWMIPNQRRSMMRSSFFVVLYADFLIIAQYIYGLNLNDSELPTKISGINLQQIGFSHPYNDGIQPCFPLFVKTSFLLIFWITSHQYFKEKADQKVHNDVLMQFFGVSFLRSDNTLFEKSRAHRAFIFIVESVSNLITRMWMWLLIFLIFLCAMIDKVMTGFRICYMSLFLLFLMAFQMSLHLWIKFLYGYWMFVIFYAMTILTIIYTYQFDYFDYYWENFLHVKTQLQSDIGLRRYRTKELFLHLLVPTLTVIFTVVQLHYFHHRFMASVRNPSGGRKQFSHFQFNPTIGSHLKSGQRKRTWIRILSIWGRKLRATYFRWFRPSKIFAWRFLEMHMIKAVTLAAFVCAIAEVCCFNLIFVILVLLSICWSPLMRRVIFRIITFWTSVLILMKMIYQIKYLDESHYEYNCNNVTVNFADWMGLRKTDQKWGSLLRYLAPYIVYLIVTTLHAVVKLRDHLIRLSLGEVRDPSILFPHTSRQDAERNFSGLLKYLLNYGYFKFGLEITFIALVSSIAHRRDVLAVTYVIWLIILLCLNRMQCARIWYIFQLYFVVSIFVQYLHLIHFPPNLCIAVDVQSINDTRPLEDIFNSVRSKLMLDFIVLMLISRQRRAFKAELHQMNNFVYPGGDNRNIVHNIAKLGHVYFKNPTHDFCSFVRNYSDVFKTVVFCSFLWITLAIVFMGGVCSMDMLSLGYLVFALVFLLQGSEVYLDNIHYIIWRWNLLIAFNVFNIALKVCIIVFGKMFAITHKQDYQSLFAVMEYDKTVPQPEVDKQQEENEGYYYGPNSLIFENMLVWHAIIFAFVIFQNRIFRSYYFCHIINDTQANTVLASRGAIIIENLHYKQIYDRREYEKKVLEKVKAKMEQIRANNVKNFIKIRARKAQSSATTQEEIEPKNEKTQTPGLLAQFRFSNIRTAAPKRRDLRLHPHAVRSGDYYMFDDQEDADEPIVNEEYDFLEKEEMHNRQMLAARKKNKGTDKASGYSSDSEIDFDTHPVVKLTNELVMLTTVRLNRLSRNYRFVHKVLSAEKKTLQDISTMNRLGLVNTAAMFSFLNQSLYEKQLDPINAPSGESTIKLMSKREDFTTLDHNQFVQLLISLYYAIIANTEVVSYLTVFVNQAANSSIISLPMAFLVLYWGALTLPRPTKTFWVTLITYTLAMILLKCILHQKIVLDYKLIKLAMTMDFELFIKHGKAVYDLLLLVVLFWHRYMLKKQGIWNIPTPDTDPLPRTTQDGKAFGKERPGEVMKRLREESGADPEDSANIDSKEFERDMDDLLRPGIDKYASANIESVYYRTTMRSLEHKGGLLSGIKKFFLALLHKARLSTDVYTLIFLCDFINFFVLLFGFPKFVYRRKYNTSVLETYIRGNKVPFCFLFMLVVQFATIVAERAIYLRKALVVKIVFHFFTVIGVHIWMFFLVPYVTAQSFGASAPVIFYLIKCLHMLLSAYQIRCGYPRRILGNVFTKSYSMVNYVAFKVYMEIPFLYILRTSLDWLCIDTTLTVMEWIKMEDIFQSVFIVRCYRQMDSDFPVMRGEPKAFYAKCLIGGTIILVLITFIWSPLFIFALVGTVGKANVPRRADISVTIGHYEPIYVSQSISGIHQFSNRDYNDLVKSFDRDIYATDHIMSYNAADITAVKFDANSVTLWNMSPPDKNRLLNDLKTGKKVDIRFRLSFNSGVTSDTIVHETTYTLTKDMETTREMLIKQLSEDNSNAKVIVPDILPKFITVEKKEVFVKFIKDYDGYHNRPIILQKKQAEGKMWWEARDYCDDKFYRNILSNLPLSNCDGGIVFYIFSDKSFPSTMSFVEKTGIIGLYTTCVYVVSRIIRSLIANNHRRIMFEDLPYVDRILKLCNDIYLVRETKEYRLEEDLYGKLLFLYRSPETLIKWTRFKDDLADSGSEAEHRGRDRFQGAPSEPSEDDEQRRQQRPNTPPPP
ncbi:piezo-type mechanosensitive ion channel component [Drosophila albomicans]|uniref:Piezo-type mechanosensitive ion channel component n=1 Tax=Drosophila albomicans TaxID=7291 RepID=A0A6P8XKH3_DROAB|nr:piezo-type mechanosensitive ion channel component [Drosophila albomicans]